MTSGATGDSPRRVVTGWEGRYLEDFQVGDVYRHSHGRTITQTDNTWFTPLTNNTHDIHYNADYASRTEFGKPLVDSTLTLAIVTGLSVEDVSRNAVANLGWEDVRLTAPVFAGDTIYAESEVLAVRPSKSRPGRRAPRLARGVLDRRLSPPGLSPDGRSVRSAGPAGASERAPRR